MAKHTQNCPHCGAKAPFTPVSSAQYTSGNYTFIYSKMRCDACDALILHVDRHETGYHSTSRFVGQYPTIATAEIKHFTGIVPESVLEDFEEALRCFEVEAYRACAAMCRRSLESASIERGADRSKKLYEQIDSLPIAQDIKDWMHEIRYLGNWGAHPEDDELKDIDKDAASEIIDFIKQFFTYVYVMPQRVANSRVSKVKKQ